MSAPANSMRDKLCRPIALARGVLRQAPERHERTRALLGHKRRTDLDRHADHHRPARRRHCQNLVENGHLDVVGAVLEHFHADDDLVAIVVARIVQAASVGRKAMPGEPANRLAQSAI